MVPISVFERFFSPIHFPPFAIHRQGNSSTKSDNIKKSAFALHCFQCARKHSFTLYPESTRIKNFQELIIYESTIDFVSFLDFIFSWTFNVHGYNVPNELNICHAPQSRQCFIYHHKLEKVKSSELHLDPQFLCSFSY